MSPIDVIKLAKAFMAAGKYNKAEAILQPCVVPEIELLPAIDLLISVYRRQGRLEEAVALRKKLDCLVANLSDLSDVPFVNVASALSGAGLVPAPFHVIRNVLTLSQVDRLLQMAGQYPNQFEYGKVSREYGVVLDRRNSLRLVAENTGDLLSSLLYPYICNEFARCCSEFAVPHFDIGNIEYKYCHYPHGSYFRVHRDDLSSYKNEKNDKEIFQRRISFVYYFHRTPKKFHGGDLLLHDTDRENNLYSPESYVKVVPENNTLIFFHSGFHHQVTDVVESSGDALNGRFCINGHICAAVPVDMSLDDSSIEVSSAVGVSEFSSSLSVSSKAELSA